MVVASVDESESSPEPAGAVGFGTGLEVPDSGVVGDGEVFEDVGFEGVGFDGEVFDGLFGPEPSGSELSVACDVDDDVVSVPVLSFERPPLEPHASVVTSVEASKPKSRQREQPGPRVLESTLIATRVPHTAREMDRQVLDS